MMLAAVIAHDATDCSADELLVIARALAPLVEDAVNFYLSNGTAPLLAEEVEN
jgi:hypothetical protein